MDELSLGERISLMRRRHHMTQQQLAAVVGVTQAEIHRLESGLILDPHLSVAVKLATALRVRMDWLCGLADE